MNLAGVIPLANFLNCGVGIFNKSLIHSNRDHYSSKCGVNRWWSYTKMFLESEARDHPFTVRDGL